MILPDLHLDLSIELDQELLPQLKAFEEQSTLCTQHHFETNNKIRDVILARSNHIDELVTTLWEKLSLPEQCALVAVGGYGRGELHPFSDIDLLILVPEKNASTYSQSITQFITYLWDVGLIVGHAVRSLKECLALAKDDITIATNVMESRLLVGNSTLFQQLAAETAPSKMWDAESFIEAKKLEQKQRYKKFDGSSFDLEPNLKSSPGGLRDIHLIGWIAQRRYYPKSIFQLIQDQVITKKEYYTLIKNQLFLWRIRFALHKVSGKAEDRLLFDYQKDTATYLGFTDDEQSMAVEKMMKRYYRSVLIIRNISEILLQALEEKTVSDRLDATIPPIDKHYQLSNKRLDVVDSNLFLNEPGELIRIFEVLSNTSDAIGVTSKTLRSIRAARNQINKKYIQSPKNQRLFIQFWNNKKLSSRAIFAMKRSGVLSDYLPAFRLISGQMQYDMFHSYTVDEHTLFLIRNLTEFNNLSSKQEFPLCFEYMAEIENPKLIYLAGLFHDIGKGRGGDHSEIGAIEAELFCKSHGLSEEETEIICWLVANHLLMSLTAQKRDTSDPNVIKNFAEQVGSSLKLKLLYLLTVADIRATSRSLWNSWKDSLLKELAISSIAILSHSSHHLLETWKESKHKVKELLNNKGHPLSSIDQHLDRLSKEYFIKTPTETIAWQTENILLNCKNKVRADEKTDIPIVAIRERLDGGGMEIFIHSEDKDNLFADITATIAKHHLNVQGASIYTDKQNYCHDSFFTLNEQGTAFIKKNDQQLIVDAIKKSLHSSKPSNIRIQKRMPRQIKHFEVNTKIVFSNDEFSPYTRLDMVSRDRAGLLAILAQAFKQCGIRLHDARITTLGEKVEDTFIISHKDNTPIIDTVDRETLSNAIKHHIDELN